LRRVGIGLDSPALQVHGFRWQRARVRPPRVYSMNPHGVRTKQLPVHREMLNLKRCHRRLRGDISSMVKYRTIEQEHRAGINRLQLGFKRFIHAIGPKIVQLFTIGEISSTKLQGNSLDNTFTLDCELPSTCAIRIHAETQGGQIRRTESLGDVVVIHPLDPEDGSSIIPIRTAGRTQKGVRWRIDARKQFDALMDGVSPPDDVTFESATVGDVPGLWVHPASSRSRRFCICTGGGSTREAPRHIATLSGTSP
jgi:hypothetical protein